MVTVFRTEQKRALIVVAIVLHVRRTASKVTLRKALPQRKLRTYNLFRHLTQPSRDYHNTQILDNSGYFFANGLNLNSSFVTLRADGFYFNEVCGEPSNAQITLNAITDLNNVPAVNVNTLTHLEKARVEYLVPNGTSFSKAKEQALKEVLYTFSIDTTGTMPSSETEHCKFKCSRRHFNRYYLHTSSKKRKEFSDLMAILSPILEQTAS